jgi:hypothetical protein
MDLLSNIYIRVVHRFNSITVGTNECSDGSHEYELMLKNQVHRTLNQIQRLRHHHHNNFKSGPCRNLHSLNFLRVDPDLNFW